MTARVRCGAAGCDHETYHATYDQAATDLWRHHEQAHTGNPPVATVQQLPQVQWHAQALQAIRALAATGEPFVIADVLRYGVTDPPNPRTDWPKVTAEAEALGWIEHAGFGKSTRPTVRGSAVRQWRGTYAAKRGVA